VWGEKSWLLVAAMQGALRIGAIYVPIAAGTPPLRARAILKDCAIHCIVTDRRRFEELRCFHDELAAILIDDLTAVSKVSSDQVEVTDITSNDLAYILYTSGSTGQPKGVCISHQNAISFIEWAVSTLEIPAYSRFANHASFSFDLSVFDLYAAFATLSCVTIVPESISCSAWALVELIRREQITVWYSVPSSLVLMIERAALLKQPKMQIKTLISAGEVCPIRYLRAVRASWPHVKLWNFYGPTETNVCAAYEIVHISPNRAISVPVGRACSGDRLWLRDLPGCASAGAEGELMVEGPTVMLGYWGCEPQKGRPYATGDICRLEPDGNFLFLGRIDNMVKLRGYRIELQEIEAVLASYPGISDVAVLVLGEGVSARLVCFFVSRQSPPTLIQLKEHCALYLPPYMLVSLAWRLHAMPRTSNGKSDRLRLTEIANELGQSDVPTRACIGKGFAH
jgi:amino acid adenylation domain-containing protein